MDEKVIQETAPKITRARARHLRRKRLITARKTAELNSNTEINAIKKADSVEDKSVKINEIGCEITKSKARRLKKKNKIVHCQSTFSLENSEIRSSNFNLCSINEDSHADAGQSRMELLENEKNLANNNIKKNDIYLKNKLHTDSDIFNSELILNKTSVTQNSLLNNNYKDVISHDAALLSHAVLNLNNTIIDKDFLQLTKNELKMNSETKTREQIKAEREAKKAAKLAMKTKNKNLQQKSDTLLLEETVLPNAASKKSNENDAKVESLTNEVSKLSVVNSDKKSTESTVINEGKSKAELRAERRLKQEAQRAAKQEQLEKKNTKVELSKLVKSSPSSTSSSKVEEQSKKEGEKKIMPKENCHEVSLFKHLYHDRAQARMNFSAVNSNIHPAIIRLGVQYANEIIIGSNSRCIALLSAIKQLIADFERPAHADFNRGFQACLQESSSYLNHCRPIAVSMHNALKHLMWQMTQFPSTISDEEAKSVLSKAIDVYIQEQIILAAEMISRKIQTKISNGDVILTYGFSSLIEKILCDAHNAGRQFRVIVVDGRPWLEGKELLRRLVNHGIECSYILINALSFVMPEVNKVFLGAHAILANGAVMSRAGTAQVALMAKAFNVPVLVSCEMHKSSERVQTDSIVYNEIDDADKLLQNFNGNMKKSPLSNWRMKKSLNLLNIKYDVTPASLVTGVVTELAILPCSSVPVILRIKPSEM